MMHSGVIHPEKEKIKSIFLISRRGRQIALRVEHWTLKVEAAWVGGGGGR